MMTAEKTAPRAWVGCLACYNEGRRLVGVWVDGREAADENPHGDPDEWAEYGHEEFWVFAHEGYHGLIDGECSPAEAQRLAELLDEVCEPEAFALFVSDRHGSIDAFGDEDETREAFEDAYAGVWDDEQDYAAELADEVYGLQRGDVAEVIARYFDYDAFARDLFMSDYWSAPASGGGVHVFRAV